MNTGYPSIDKPWMKYYPNNRAKFVHESMYDCLVRNNEKNRNVIALKYFGKQISFDQMFRMIDDIANVFENYGVKEDDRIIVLGLNSPEIICSIYAINKLGAIACMEYVTQTEDNLKKITIAYKSKYAVVIDNFYEKYAEILLDAGVDTIFLASSYSSMPFPMNLIAKSKMKIKGTPKRTVDIHATLRQKRYTKSNICANKNKIAVVLSTSGTTGIPKRAEISNDAINALAYQGKYVDIELNVGASMLTPAPPFLAFGISLTTHMPLCNGTCLILSISPDPDFVSKQFIKYKPSLFMGGHVFLDKLMLSPKVKKMDLSFVSAIELGGESISEDYADKVDHFFKAHNYKGHIFVGYGMTELSACSTTEQACANKRGTVGIPLCDVTFKVRNIDDGKELRYNEIGELLISSPCMMTQYFNNSNATTEIIEVANNGERWIHTGDLGSIDEDGFITVVGRMKRIELTIDPISNAQCKLYPDYIELILRSCEFVDECAVVTADDETRVHVPVAFVKPKQRDISIDDIKKYMISMIEPFNVPSKYFILSDIPIRPNGKIDYQQLERIILNEDK